MDHEKAPKRGISSQASADTFIVIKYSGYLRLSQQDVTLVGGMAHARRKFYDSLPKDKARESDATSVAKQGIHYCDQMFSLERAWGDLSVEEIYEKR